MYVYQLKYIHILSFVEVDVSPKSFSQITRHESTSYIHVHTYIHHYTHMYVRTRTLTHNGACKDKKNHCWTHVRTLRVKKRVEYY